MATEDPSIEQPQPVSPQADFPPSDPSKQPKGKKKKKKKKRKTKKGFRSSHHNPKSYGAGPRFNRRESIPHHATVQSLASINQPIIVNQLSKMSQDLKYQRELKKALTELRQKDEDYRYAIEIGESLTKENEYLKEQIEIIESQLHHQDTVNATYKEKLETLSSTYHSDLYKYHQDLQAHKELVNDLTNSLQNTQQELSQQKEINQKRMNQSDRNNRDEEIHNNRRYERMTSDDISNLKSEDFGSTLEKQLYIQLDKQKRANMDKQQTIETLMKKLDDMNGLKKKYDSLKKENRELKQFGKAELSQHIQMQKSIEQQAIYLAAKTANLEEETESLLNLLDQRDYEITMLNQQLALQKKALSINQNMESTLGDDIGSDENDEYYDYNDGMDNMESDEEDEMLDDKDEIDIIAEILDDEDLFDDDDGDDDDGVDDDESPQPQTQSQTHIGNKYGNEGQLQSIKPRKKKEESEESRDKKAFDKIKEYLHLTASAVKIKYPTVKDIQSDELIKRVRELPFYKYHDQMVRIMETQIRDEKKKAKANVNNKGGDVNNNNEAGLDDGRPIVTKRKSFLDIFKIFGNGDDKSNDGSDVENADDNKSDGGVSDNEEHDSGISTRRRRGSKRRRKSKSGKKKKKHRKSLSKSDNEMDNGGNKDSKGGVVPSGTKYKRGVSVQASAKRLKNT